MDPHVLIVQIQKLAIDTYYISCFGYLQLPSILLVMLFC